jgi:glutathione peroxidase
MSNRSSYSIVIMLRLSIIVALVALTAVLVVRAARAPAKADVIKEPSTMPTTAPSGPLSFEMTDIDGKPFNLASLKGKVVLLVNVASRCGFTPQYTGLEKLYTDYKDQGFVIVGIPANNFGGQEPGTNEEIKTFCSSKYMVTFPMLSKVSVKGDDKTPLYKYLTEKETAGDFAGEITWNFNKFLIDRNGQIMARFDSATTPQDPKVIAAVEKAIGAKSE